VVGYAKSFVGIGTYRHGVGRGWGHFFQVMGTGWGWDGDDENGYRVQLEWGHICVPVQLFNRVV